MLTLWVLSFQASKRALPTGSWRWHNKGIRSLYIMDRFLNPTKKLTRSEMPSSVARFTSFCSSGPSPISQRVTFGNFRIAFIKTSKPFRGTNRPLAYNKIRNCRIKYVSANFLEFNLSRKIRNCNNSFSQPKSRQRPAIPGRFPTKISQLLKCLSSQENHPCVLA